VLATGNRHRLLVIAADGMSGPRRLSTGAELAVWVPEVITAQPGGEIS
jgi:hypothetical protein